MPKKKKEEVIHYRPICSLILISNFDHCPLRFFQLQTIFSKKIRQIEKHHEFYSYVK